jgi:uroporphyrin-III C-methyltransferase
VTVALVGAGPGDPGLLTRRGADLLAEADVVVYDRLVAPELLDLAPTAAERIDVGKGPGQSGRQADINELLIARGRSGCKVVRLKGGDPFVFGRGGEEAEALRRAGVDVEVVPGVSSAFAAPAAAGIPVTHRNVSTSVTVVTGHAGDPALPGIDWEALGRLSGTLVILMGMGARATIAQRLLSVGREATTPVAVIHWGTTDRQRVVRTDLAHLPDVDLPAPAAIVIGAVADLDVLAAVADLEG